MSNAKLDAAAKQKGFPDYATYKAWETKYGQKARNKNAGKNGSSQGTPKNWLQKIGMMHPAKMLGYVADKVKAATGNE
jgi:hypothetical protein